MPALVTRLTGLVLLVFAVVWTVVALRVIPEGFGETLITPRTFPVALGVILALLSLVLVAGTFLKDGHEEEEAAPAAGDRSGEIWAIACTFGFLLVYVFALDLVGFVIATAVVPAATLFFVLRTYSPWVLVGVPLGLTFGIWFVMGKLMGVYLPHGTLIHGI